jgi:hypothetical protein
MSMTRQTPMLEVVREHAEPPFSGSGNTGAGNGPTRRGNNGDERASSPPPTEGSGAG